MVDANATFTAIAMMAAIVYLTRVTGYFIGLQLRHIRGIQPVLEALPGCAFMAILAPAVRQGSISEGYSHRNRHGGVTVWRSISRPRLNFVVTVFNHTDLATGLVVTVLGLELAGHENHSV
jgi:branched-subunit amino acid transport protein